MTTTSKPGPKPVKIAPVKPKPGAAKLSAEALLRTIRDRHVDVKEGDMSFIYGDPDNKNFTEPKMWFPTGLRLMDAILGNGGFGSGRVCEVYGPNKTAKSEFAQTCLETFLNTFPTGIGFYFDQEQAVDEKKRCRVPVFKSGRMSWEWSPYAERLFGKVISMVEDVAATAPNTPIFIVVDSLAGLETKEEMDKGLDEVASRAAIARLLSRTFRKLKPVLQCTNTFLMILNQIRHQMNQPSFVDDESPGGEALKFWADYRIKTSPAGSFYFKPNAADDDNPLPPDGLKVAFKTIKNKLAPPLRRIVLPVLFAPKMGSRSGLSDIWGTFEHLNKVVKAFKVAGGRYFMEVPNPVTPSGPPDKVSFARHEWPMFLAENPDVVKSHMDRWTKAVMMEEGAEDIEDVEDTDFAGPKIVMASDSPRKSLLPPAKAA
jgi:RecA/RadA recombinase